MDSGARSGRDLTTAALVAVASLILVEAYPRTLHPDEAILLYEARRIVAGDVPYRDFFTIFAPGSEWLFAALFRLFGTTFGTSRHAMAMLHGAIASGMFLMARSVGVRPVLALAAAAVHAAAALPQFAAATPHWVGTALLLALIGALLRLARHEWRRGAFVVGAVAGALLFTEHPKGLVAIAVTGVVLLAAGRGMVRPLVGFALGLLVVAGSLALVLEFSAGLGLVYDALVRVPLGGYNQNPQNRGTWPRALLPVFTSPIEPHLGVTPVMDGLTLWLPRLAVIPIVRTLLGVVRTGSIPPVPLVLAAGGVMALGAVSYNPNPVHLATVLPVFAIVAAESAEIGLSRLERRGWRWLGWLPAAVTTVLIVQAAHFPPCLRPRFPVKVATAFGWLDGRPSGPETQAAQQAALAGTGGRVFIYPACPHLYLTLGLSNPTRFQTLLPDLDPPDHFREAVTSLERLEAPYVFRCWSWFALKLDDPVLRYVQEHYGPPAPIPGGQLFRRKGAGATSG